jgi:hypothetical protein
MRDSPPTPDGAAADARNPDRTMASRTEARRKRATFCFALSRPLHGALGPPDGAPDAKPLPLKQPRRRAARQLPVRVVSGDFVHPVDLSVTRHPID